MASWGKSVFRFNTKELNLITLNGIAPHPIPLPSEERGDGELGGPHNEKNLPLTGRQKNSRDLRWSRGVVRYRPHPAETFVCFHRVGYRSYSPYCDLSRRLDHHSPRQKAIARKSCPLFLSVQHEEELTQTVMLNLVLNSFQYWFSIPRDPEINSG
jgi:hypothetical protein